MNLFIEAYDKGKITILEELEAPDFIVEIDGKQVGVELTEVFQDSNQGPSELKRDSSDGSSFTEELIRFIQPNIDFTFSIGIHFNRHFPLKKSNRQDILKNLKEKCLPAMINLINHQHVELENYYDNLPDEIDNIHISRFDGMEESIDSRPEGGTVAKLTLDHLKPILSSKETKLPLYKKCDKQWLLIREGNYYAGSFSNDEVNISIQSDFDKVFLFRARTREIIELK